MNTKRFVGFFIDYIITACIMNVPFWFLVMYPLISGNTEAHKTIILRTFISMYISVLYLIFRDVPKSGSIGKKVVKIKIIDSETKGMANISKRIFRNITWLFGPVEIVFYLFTGKRIGDLLAKTDVVIR